MIVTFKFQYRLKKYILIRFGINRLRRKMYWSDFPSNMCYLDSHVFPTINSSKFTFIFVNVIFLLSVPNTGQRLPVSVYDFATRRYRLPATMSNPSRKCSSLSRYTDATTMVYWTKSLGYPVPRRRRHRRFDSVPSATATRTYTTIVTTRVELIEMIFFSSVRFSYGRFALATLFFLRFVVLAFISPPVQQ